MGVPWLFVTKKGTPLILRMCAALWALYSRFGNLFTHHTPHCLRHSYASTLWAVGVALLSWGNSLVMPALSWPFQSTAD